MASLDELMMKTLVRTPLGEANYRAGDPRSGFRSIKDLLRHGHGDIDFRRKGAYQVGIDISKYHDIIEASYYSSICRVLIHQRSLPPICQSTEIPKAWAVVTIYYSCFFSALTLMNVAGLWPIYFDAQEVADINQNVSAGNEVEVGSYLFVAQPLSSEFCFKAKKVDSGGGIHALVWSQMRNLISFKRDKVRHEDQHAYERLNQILSQDWGVPSEVRNTWNYKISGYYGQSGDSIYSEAAQDDSAIFSWVKRTVRHPKDADQVAGIYYLQRYFGRLAANASSIIATGTKKSEITKLINENKAKGILF